MDLSFSYSYFIDVVIPPLGEHVRVADGDLRQIGGVNPAPIPIHGDSAILERHMVEVSPRLGVRVGVFRFAPTAVERRRSAGEDERIHGIERMILNVYRYIHANFAADDRVQVDIESSDLNLGNVTSALVTVSRADPFFILDCMEYVIQSNQAVHVDSGDFHVRVTHVPAIRGAGYTAQRAAILEHFTTVTQEVLEKTKAIHPIDRALDPFCGVAALILGKAIVDSKGTLLTRREYSRWKQMNRKTVLRKQCYRTVKQAKLGNVSKGISLNQLRDLANSAEFCDYKIIVYSTSNYNLPVAVENEISGWRGEIMLLFDDTKHFSIITKPNAFFGKEGYYCPTCYKFFTGSSANHSCSANLCKQCKTAFCSKSSEAEIIRCTECKRAFFGEICYQRHLSVGSSPLVKHGSVCDRFKACPLCNRDLREDGTNAYDRSAEGRKHVCFKNKCRECGLVDNMSTHECYIQPINVKSSTFQNKQWKDRGHQWFYDMETMKVWDEDKQAFFFVPNLIVLKSERGVKHVFAGESALQEFCEFCFAGEDSLAHQDERQVLWAHNSARFDGMFVLQGFCNLMSSDPSVVFDGRSPIQIKWKKACFKDTFKYVMTSLAAWSKQFGLKLLKGYFPRGFNTPENQHYVGLLPAERFFETKFMSEKQYSDFKQWYDEKCISIETGCEPLWDFQVEMLKYCENILQEAWLMYQTKMFEHTGIFPGGLFDMSAASYTNLVWKSTLDPQTIGVIPTNNYVRNDNQSEIAREWLNFEDMIYYGGELLYSGKGSGGEQRISLGNAFYKVDGFHPQTNTVLEFAGCFYHGCKNCTRPEVRFPLNNLRFEDLNTKFANTMAYLKNRGFEVHVMWECEWKKMRQELETASLLKEICEYIPDASSINPQDALYGGRTGVASVFFPARGESSKTHEVRGYDYVSLYPAVNANEEYPVGHPRVVMDAFDRFDRTPDHYFGLIKCVLLPPQDLFHPVLPYRVPAEGNSIKLVFPLCRTCAINRQKEICRHNERERCLDGTWPSTEVYLAIKRGYKFLKISAVWDYVNRSRALFKEFVRKFYKLKAEASGYPSQCKTVEEKKAYLEKFEEVEGIRLDPANVKYDPAARAGSKLQLNSLWGKWAQRLDERKTTRIFHDAVTLHRFVNDAHFNDFELHLINAETGMVKGKSVKALQRPNTKGNCVQAAFTTSHGRGWLYRLLEELGEAVMYFDTDSVFIRAKIGEKLNLPFGDFLGQLGPVYTEKCVECGFLGPKNYYLRFNNNSTCVKVRGMTFNRTSSQIVNADLMRDIVNESVRINREGTLEEKIARLSPTSGFVEDAYEVPRFTMKRGTGCSDPFSISPREEIKRYGVVFDKRFVDWKSDKLLAFPFGFVKK